MTTGAAKLSSVATRDETSPPWGRMEEDMGFAHLKDKPGLFQSWREFGVVLLYAVLASAGLWAMITAAVIVAGRWQ